MQIVVSAAAAQHVGAHGGRLYVWFEPRRCCSGGYTFLGASTEPPRRLRGGAPSDFQRVEHTGFELFMALGRSAPPAELHIEMRGWRRQRVEAYWNGCAWVAGAPSPVPSAGAAAARA